MDTNEYRRQLTAFRDLAHRIITQGETTRLEPSQAQHLTKEVDELYAQLLAGYNDKVAEVLLFRGRNQILLDGFEGMGLLVDGVIGRLAPDLHKNMMWIINGTLNRMGMLKIQTADDKKPRDGL